MRIKGPGETNKTQGKSKTGDAKKTGDSSFEKLVSDDADAQKISGTSGTSATSAPTSLDALLSLQEFNDSDSGSRQKAKERADEILEKLDELRMGLLSGGVSVATLQDLSKRVSDKRDTIDDPQLKEILDEIDLRAQVEIAKFEQR